ncbi:hypothetical protein TWF679_001887 [Orbilia oligospora]|uniref:Uncharacterized protein n=1 Tax=Orbilia oligospora TaxID=2813651 RepID=A0A8H8VGU5_ORBOL|nr:hypothetical protein TWF679_001887 [Orbilia oligospora]
MERAAPVSFSASLFEESIPAPSTEPTSPSFVPAWVYHSILPGAGPVTGHGFVYPEISYPLNVGYANNQGLSQPQTPLRPNAAYAASLELVRLVDQGSALFQYSASANARLAIILQNISPTADDRLLNSQNSNISHEATGYRDTNPVHQDAKLSTVQEDPPSSSPPQKENKSLAVKHIAGQIKGFDKEKKNKLLMVLEKAKTKKESEAVDSKKAGLSNEAVVDGPEQRPTMQEADVIAEAKYATNLAPEKHNVGNLASHPAGEEGLVVSPTPRPDIIAEHRRALPLPTKRLPEQNILSPVPPSLLRSCPPEISLLAPSPLSSEPSTKLCHNIRTSSPANLSRTMKLTQGPLGEPSTTETLAGAVAEVKPVAEAKESNIIRWTPPDPRAEHSSKTPEGGVPEKNSPMPQNTFWDSEFFFHGVASKPAARWTSAADNNKEKGKDEKGKGRAFSPEDRAGEEKLDDRYDWYQVDIEAAVGRADPPRVPFKLLQAAQLGIWGQNSGQADNTGSNESANERWLKNMKKKTEIFADSDDAVESRLTGNAPALPSAVRRHSIGPGPAEPDYALDKVDEDQCGPRTWHELTRYWEDHRAQQVAEFNPDSRPVDRYFKVPTLGLLGSPLTSGGEVEGDYGEQARKRARLEDDLFMDQSQAT